jgi:DNA-binding transcriptional LysR family regulator
MKSLDVEAVQAFVLVADLRSFTRAAEALDTTQSAISLKIKRLEEGLGRRLFERTPRLVRLSAEGSQFLDPARALVEAHQQALGAFALEQRRLCVGVSHHIVGAELPSLLRRLDRSEPGLTIEMRVGTSRQMLEEFDRGLLDAAITLGHEHRRDGGEPVLREDFAWVAAPDFEHRSGEPLRLATQAPPCTVRAMALGALDGAGIPWTEVFVGGGVATIGAAVSAGLAVAALGRRVAPADTVDVGAKFGLPSLPQRDVMLFSTVTDPRGRDAVRTLVAAIRSTATH